MWSLYFSSHPLPLPKVVFESDIKFETYFTEGCGLGNN